VTKPTTINAITDIPAKIPRPIGSTEIFFPGIWKAAAALEDALAVLSAAADRPLLDEDLEDLVEVDGGVVDDGALVAAGLGTEETPTTDTPGSTGLVDAGGGEEVEEGGASEDEDVEAAVLVEGGSVCVSEDWAPGTTVHCRTTCTRCSPLFPVTGVNVTMHVSVTGPEGVLIVCTV
jgi:hypothetical protein